MSKELYLSPAEVVVRSFGGIVKTAKVLGLKKQDISFWFDSKKRKQSLGLIPTHLQKKIYLAAQEVGVHISAKDLVMGRTIGLKNG